MTVLVLGLVLAAAGSTELEGAATAGVLVAGRPQAASVSMSVHGRAEVSREFGRYFLEGHASVLFSPLGGGGSSVSDLGSRLTFGYRPLGFVERVSLEVLPFNPWLRLPSFDWANAWGRPLFPAASFAPVLTAEVATKAGSVWVSARFKTVQDLLSGQQVLVVEPIVVLAVPLGPAFRLEARFAWLNDGTSPALATLGVKLPLTGAGGGARLSWTLNEPVGPALDLMTYGSDPLRFERFFALERRRSPVAAQVMLEGGAAGQQLADPERFGEGKTQFMGWVDLQARVRLRDVRLFATARAQSVTLALFDMQGFVPATALTPTQETGPLIAGYLGADVTIPSAKLTPGLLLRVTRYGWLRSPLVAPGGNNPIPGSLTHAVMVGPNGFIRFLGDRPVAPFLAATASLRWEVVSFASMVTEVQVEKDLNDYSDSGLLIVQPMSSDQLTVTAQLYLQGRF